MNARRLIIDWFRKLLGLDSRTWEQGIALLEDDVLERASESGSPPDTWLFDDRRKLPRVKRDHQDSTMWPFSDRRKTPRPRENGPHSWPFVDRRKRPRPRKNLDGGSAWPFEDRRREPRVRVSLPSRYRIKGRGLGWFSSETLDVSRSGVGLRLMVAREPVRAGTVLEIEVKLPDMPKKFRIKGVVAWVKPSFSTKTAGVQCGVLLQNLKDTPRRDRMVHFLADKLCEAALHQSEDLVCRPAESLEELKDVYRLLYREYLARGYCAQHSSEMHYNVYCLLPETSTFVLKRGDVLLGTIALIPDSGCGLPMEVIYPEEVGKLRAEGRRLAEVGFLALDHKLMGNGFFSLTTFHKHVASFRLFKTMFDYARSVASATDLVIGVHPKHESLYRYLTFEPIGPVRSYPGACKNPALLMRMDIRRTVETISMSHGKGFYFLREAMPFEQLKKHFFLDASAVYELSFVAHSLWPELSAHSQSVLKSYYPALLQAA